MDRYDKFAFNNPPAVNVGALRSAENNPMGTWLGLPSFSPEQHSLNNYNQTSIDLPQTLMGQSTFLADIVSMGAVVKNDAVLQVVLPITINNGPLQAHWSATHYPAEMPDLVPEHGVVRFVRANQISGTVSYRRYGMGIRIGISALTQPAGQLRFAMHLRQVNQGFVEAMVCDAVHALVNVENYEIREAAKHRVGAFSPSQYRESMRRVIQNSIDNWACLQLQALNPGNAWAQLDTRITEAAALIGVTDLNTYLVDVRCSIFNRQIAHDQVTASIFGPGAQQNVRSGVQYIERDFNGNQIVNLRPSLVGSRPFNLLQKYCQIGEFFADTDRAVVDWSNYSSAHRRQRFYNEDIDGLGVLTLADKIRNCQRFLPDGRLRSINSLDAARLGNASQETLANNDFLHRYDTTANRAVPISYVGQMRTVTSADGSAELGYSPTDYNNWALTVFAQLKRYTGLDRADFENVISELQEDLRVIGSYPFDVEYNLWCRALSLQNTSSARNTGVNRGTYDSVDARPNEWGSLDFDARAEDVARRPAWGPLYTRINQGGKKWVLPPTHGTYGGFQTIRKSVEVLSAADERLCIFSLERMRRVAANIKKFEQFAHHLAIFHPDCVLLSRAWAYGAVHTPTAAHVLFDNLVARSFPFRRVFLHSVEGVADPNTLPATRTIQHAPEPESIPQFTEYRQHIMNAYLGNMVMAIEGVGGDAGVGGRAAGFLGNNADQVRDETRLRESYIGAPISGPPVQSGVLLETGLPGAGIRNRPTQLRWASVQPDPRGFQRAQRRVGGGPLGNEPFNFNQLAMTVAGGVASFSGVFDAVVRWTFWLAFRALPQQAKLNYLDILGIISLVNFDVDDATLSDRLRALITAIETETGIALSTNNGVLAAGLPDQFNTITGTRITEAAIRAMRATPGLFDAEVTESFLDRLHVNHERLIGQAGLAPIRARIPLDAAPGDGLLARDVAVGGVPAMFDIIDNYKRSGLAMGEAAVKTFNAYRLGHRGYVYAIPASWHSANAPMSGLDFTQITAYTGLPIDQKVEYLKNRIGPIFAENYNSHVGDLDVSNLEAVRLAIEYGMTPADKRVRETMRAAPVSVASAALPRRSNMTVRGYVEEEEVSEPTPKRIAARGSAALLAPSAVTDEAIAREFSDEDVDEVMRDNCAGIIAAVDGAASQIIALLRAFTPVTRRLLEAEDKYNLHHLFWYLCARPHANYQTLSAIKMVAGRATGFTSFGHVLALAADDNVTAEHTVSFHAYSGPTIVRPENVFVVDNVMVTGYDGGMGGGFVQPQGYAPEDGRFGERRSDSFFIIAIPRGTVLGNTVALSGAINVSDHSGTLVKSYGDPEYTYPTARYYSALWGWRGSRGFSDFSLPKTVDDSPRRDVVPNQVCHSGYALFYTDGGQESVNTPTGHWPLEACGASVRKIRYGLGSFAAKNDLRVAST